MSDPACRKVNDNSPIEGNNSRIHPVIHTIVWKQIQRGKEMVKSICLKTSVCLHPMLF